MHENPYSQFTFLVSVGGARPSGEVAAIVGGFAEVSGLETTPAVLEYRAGTEEFNTRKLASIAKFNEVTLKRGMIDAEIFGVWIARAPDEAVDRREVVITMTREAGNPVVTYALHNAWPKGVAATHLNAGADAIAIETLTLAHEGITIMPTSSSAT